MFLSDDKNIKKNPNSTSKLHPHKLYIKFLNEIYYFSIMNMQEKNIL